MLSNNLSAILTYFKAGEAYSINQQKVRIYVDDDTRRNAWLKSSGTLDLIALTFKDINIATSDILPTFSANRTQVATNRGEPCLLVMSVIFEPNICPKLQGYIVPRLGKFRGAICHIHNIEDEATLIWFSRGKLGFSFEKKLIPGEYDPDLLQDIFQRLYDLPYILEMKSIKLNDIDDIKVNTLTGDIILDPSDFVDETIFSPDDIEINSEVMRQHLRTVDPGGYISKLKPHPELKKSVCLYDLPEISKSISKERIKYLVSRYSGDDEVMCLISIGKADELELVANFSSSVVMTGDSRDANQELTSATNLFVNYLSPQLPYNRYDIDGLPDDDPYTYQARYAEKRYASAGTREQTEILNPEELGFKYFLEGVEFITGTRNKLAKTKGVSYYDAIYGVDANERLLGHLTFVQRDRVTINGIEFKKEELRPFYATLFYDIVAYTSQTEDRLEIPYVSVKDLRLMKEFVKGRLMLEALYYQLSDEGYKYLSGQGTLLEYSEIQEVRNSFNSFFSFGESPISHLQNLRPSKNANFVSLLLQGLGIAP